MPHVIAEGDNPGYALRFPRATNPIRTDKSPEDAATEKEIVAMFGKQTRSEVKE